MPDEKRIFILVDGMSSFREGYEYSKLSALWDIFLTLATDGRPLGIHLVVSGDRTNSVPASLLASIQKRLVLRLSSEDDYMTLDVPKDVLNAASPPGRGCWTGWKCSSPCWAATPTWRCKPAKWHKLSQAMLRQGLEQAPADPAPAGAGGPGHPARRCSGPP
jgi:S-DNA-T family DNA segregation ATPase FtsK/SpoIIIE